MPPHKDASRVAGVALTLATLALTLPALALTLDAPALTLAALALTLTALALTLAALAPWPLKLAQLGKSRPLMNQATSGQSGQLTIKDLMLKFQFKPDSCFNRPSEPTLTRTASVRNRP